MNATVPRTAAQAGNIDETLTQFDRAAVLIAARAALRYMEANKLVAPDDVMDRALKFHVKQRLDEALNDAREALDAHMDSWAAQTFAASIALAGIEAARECGVPEAEVFNQKRESGKAHAVKRTEAV